MVCAFTLRTSYGTAGNVPGFSAQLVGLNAGDHTDFTLDVPDDFDAEELRGRTIRVDAHVEQVRSRVLPSAP